MSDATRRAAEAIAGCQTLDELRTVQDEIKARWGLIQRRDLRQMDVAVGTVVEFQTRNGGGTHRAEVIRVNRKTCTVRSVNGYGEWRVPASLLTIVEG